MRVNTIGKLLMAVCLWLTAFGTGPGSSLIAAERQGPVNPADPNRAEQTGAPEAVQFRLEVRSSPVATQISSVPLAETRMSKAWAKRSEPNPPLDGNKVTELLLPLSDTALVVQSAEGEVRLALVSPDLLVELGTGKQWTIGRSSWNWLRAQALELRVRHYGTLLDWKDARNKLPRKSVFQVTDLETGLSFRVQRRAGSQHADVQPMTKADTAIMKRIYGGQWSWKRRAILVVTDEGDRLAASMHGMPHGGDGIPGNNFSGHFCIHFRGSTTHKSDSVDMAHQLMAYKAAGRLVAYLESLEPYELAAALLEGLGQHDHAIVAAATPGLSPEDRKALDKQFDTVTAVKLDKWERSDLSEGALTEQVRQTALVSRKGSRSAKETFSFTAARASLDSPWRLIDIVKTPR
ncbi:hypothetical protein [Paenibacillus sp. HJGM_3]|uniref:hypothetical protein n=1 Tax=Paenibacillus sp. HJGM_3 TaxID=3379816 RepID=UPI00385D63F5